MQSMRSDIQDNLLQVETILADFDRQVTSTHFLSNSIESQENKQEDEEDENQQTQQPQQVQIIEIIEEVEPVAVQQPPLMQQQTQPKRISLKLTKRKMTLLFDIVLGFLSMFKSLSEYIRYQNKQNLVETSRLDDVGVELMMRNGEVSEPDDVREEEKNQMDFAKIFNLIALSTFGIAVLQLLGTQNSQVITFVSILEQYVLSNLKDGK